MEYKEFVAETVGYFEDEALYTTKNTLVGDYLVFSVIEKEEITRDILSEKLCDYFEKVELQTDRSFEKQIRVFMENLDAIVKDFIERIPKQNKKDKTPVETPRARKYYEKAIEIRDSRDNSMEKLIDYSRIMLCLYTAIIDNNHKDIGNFDFSTNCLDQERILAEMKKEKRIIIPIVGSKKKFDIKDLYSLDTCTFVITILMFQTILNERAWWKK